MNNTVTDIHTDDLPEIFKGQFEYEANLQTATPSGNFFWYRKRRQVCDLIGKNISLLSAVSAGQPSGKLVEIGCGTGLDLLLIRQLFGPSTNLEFIGLDGNRSSLQIASLRKEHFGAENVSFQLCHFIEKLPFDDHSIDMLYCSEVIEHMLQPEVFLKELYRVLKPKGCLLLTTPNEPNVFQKAFWLSSARSRLEAVRQSVRESPRKFKIDGREIDLYGHVSCRTIQEWDKALAQAGFKLIDYRRGAIAYGGTEMHDSSFFLALKFLIESILDLLPRSLTRSFSNDMIALYQMDPEREALASTM